MARRMSTTTAEKTRRWFARYIANAAKSLEKGRLCARNMLGDRSITRFAGNPPYLCSVVFVGRQVGRGRRPSTAWSARLGVDWFVPIQLAHRRPRGPAGADANCRLLVFGYSGRNRSSRIGAGIRFAQARSDWLI